MKNRIGRSLICIAILCAIIANLGSCIMIRAVDLTDGVTPQSVTVREDLGYGNASVTDFALRLFRETEEGKNTFISPMSVLFALAMTANGASGETLLQMEQTLGMSTDELNEYVYGYLNSLSEGEKVKLKVANSIWFSDDEYLTVNQSFLQKNANYYGAEIYKAPFDATTLWDINAWVNNETNGMIKRVLDEIPKDAIMYLINTIAFEAEWPTYYKDHQVRNGVFTKADGTEENAKFMYGTESRYLEDDNSVGFIKYYRGGDYAFVALLPNEGIGLSDYLATLDGEHLSQMLSKPVSATVRTAIPKFKTEYKTEMSEVLCEMGMPLAFDPNYADFSALGSYDVGEADYNIYINSVIHKTYIEVGERGTKAGAVTVVEMDKNGSAAPPEDPKQVYLDRPFVYMIIDTENNIPLFIGTMTDING
ncbi:MAG: serpin family protein [Clostridia bacterium]|nr:serpin family protein [Clostridia bacterium]